MAHAIQMSKMRWRLVDQKYPALKSEEAFYMATKGGRILLQEKSEVLKKNMNSMLLY